MSSPTSPTAFFPPMPFQAASARSAPQVDVQTPILLVYEDMSAALGAVGQLFQIRHHIPGGFDHELCSWNFGMIERPALQGQLQANTRDARMIVIAASSSSRRLPDAVKTWLREAILGPEANPERPVAALFQHHQLPDTAADSPRLRLVEELTARAGCPLLTPATSQPCRAVA